MNEQNNNLNSQFNNFDQSSSNNTPKPIKNRFFSPEMFENNSTETLGSSVGSSVSNKVISWGVGGSTNNVNLTSNGLVNNDLNNKELNYQNQLMKDVNGVVYTDEQPEILDDSFLYGNQVNSQNNIEGNLTIQDSPLFQDNITNNENGTTVSSQSNQNVQETFNVNVNNDSDWMQQQPLSAPSLGVNIQSNDAPNDVDVQNKFLNPTLPNESFNQNLNDLYTQQAIQQSNSIVLDDPVPEIDENKLLIDYVGDRFTKISMTTFSFSAFLFGGCYFFYRKMYFWGILLSLIYILIYKFVSFPLQFAVIFVVSIIVALVACPLYLRVAKGKVKKIRKKNFKENQISLSLICKKKGGVNIFAFFLMFLIFNFVTIFLAFANIMPEITEVINNAIYNEEEKGKNDNFDGNIYFEEYDIENKFNIEIPSSFVKEDGNIFKYYYVDSNGGTENNRCTITFSKVYGFEDAYDLIDKIAKYEKVDGIEKIVTNDINWNVLSLKKENMSTHYRSMMIGDDVLLFQYDTGVNTSFGVCDTYLVDIMESLSLKED